MKVLLQFTRDLFDANDRGTVVVRDSKMLDVSNRNQILMAWERYANEMRFNNPVLLSWMPEKDFPAEVSDGAA